MDIFSKVYFYKQEVERPKNFSMPSIPFNYFSIFVYPLTEAPLQMDKVFL